MAGRRLTAKEQLKTVSTISTLLLLLIAGNPLLVDSEYLYKLFLTLVPGLSWLIFWLFNLAWIKWGVPSLEQIETRDSLDAAREKTEKSLAAAKTPEHKKYWENLLHEIDKSYIKNLVPTNIGKGKKG